MKLTDEQKVVVVLLITGTVILVVTQIMINGYGQVGTDITPGPTTCAIVETSRIKMSASKRVGESMASVVERVLEEEEEKNEDRAAGLQRPGVGAPHHFHLDYAHLRIWVRNRCPDGDP